MPLREPTESAAVSGEVCGWGGGEPTPVRLAAPADPTALAVELRRLAMADPESRSAAAIARGLGRSYGDAAQLRDGLVVSTANLRGYELDAERGTVTAQAGVTVRELLRELVPRGWILPVMPGTQHVTVGGMIASDVHGKNHAEAGSIGRHVLALGLMTASGEEIELRPGEESGGFAATVGGMGLTGVIVWARIALRRVNGSLMAVDTDRVGDLDGILRVLSEPGPSHRVAWLDLLAGGVRGVVTRADFVDAVHSAGDTNVPVGVTVPAWWPGPLPASGVRAFNALRYARTPRSERSRLEPIGAHMFPLDRLGAWPRLYGPRGFLQYQFAVPHGAEAVLERVLQTLRGHRVPCFLAVLKDFGAAGAAPLSFPIAGWTLALDLPRRASGVDAALRRCDELVAGAGGRVYLTKDARLSAEMLEAMYPRAGEWRAARAELDPGGRWRSDLGVRVGLVEPPRGRSEGRAGRPKPGRPKATRRSAASSERDPRRVLLIGGTSEIGLAIVRRLAAEGPVQPYLLGRDTARLGAALAELEPAGCADGAIATFDARVAATHEATISEAFDRLGNVDVVILAVGVLGAQSGLDADPEEVTEVLDVNVVGCGGLIVAALRGLRGQGQGSLVVLSSVAAERPRATNPVYGAAKAAVDALAQGLADSVVGSGVQVLVVRPGFVTTKMTAGLVPAPFATTPEAVAEATVRGLRGGAGTVWVPGTLRPVFSVLRHLPRPVYRRLPL